MATEEKYPKPESVIALERSLGALRIREGFEKASRLFPKTRTVIFVARECGGDTRFDYFGDNIKYAYLAFLEQVEANRVVCRFLTDSERVHKQISAAGLPCLPWFVPDWTAEDVRLLLGAKIAVFCNTFYPAGERGYYAYGLLRGARSVQLWHGIPLKAVGMESVHAPMAYTPRAAEVLGASGPFDVFVGTSAATRQDWARRFAFDRYEPAGYPRTDILLREPTLQDMINVDAAVFAEAQQAARDNKPFILYVPTFRDGEFGAWFARAGIEALAAHCAARGYALAVNLHPLECGFIDDYRKRYPGIRFIEPLTDIYPVLKHASILITDYSSLAFDFLLLDRPIIFYRPDHADYVAKSRSLITEHEAYICGSLAEDVTALARALDAAVAVLGQPANDPHRGARTVLRQKLYDHADGKAGQRLSQIILEQLEAN